MPELPYLEDVRQQYDELPYPPRDPADDARVLRQSTPTCLLAINHHCFGGKRDFRAGFRCLVAGGGTGDALIYLAEQLRDYDAEVVYLDFSRAARRIAEERARVRGLDNIRWITASIMELPDLGLGHFDLIECCGVLHHLESTEAGLQALNAVLKEDGAIYVMLYGRYGRRAVYDMQALLRDYIPPGLPAREKIRMCRQLIAALPATNSFIRHLAALKLDFSGEVFDDAEVFDLLLHAQDRCFDVPGLYALAESAGLHLLSFALRADAYEPARHVSNRAVRDYLQTLAPRLQQSLAEQMVGDIDRHYVYLARQPGRGASLGDEENALRSCGPMMRGAPEIAHAMAPSGGHVLNFEADDRVLQIPGSAIAKIIYAHMDGTTSIRSLRERILASVPGSTPADIGRELAFIYNQLHPCGYLFLHRAAPYGVTMPDYLKW
jgi:SAM-dependent methyltransferase